jgi:FixJ family two-component response regulator
MTKRDSVGLSTRESEIVRLLSEGYSNRQIARRLSIAESTVKSHLSSNPGSVAEDVEFAGRVAGETEDRDVRMLDQVTHAMGDVG